MPTETDKLGQAALEVVQAIKQVAPEVWAAALRQQLLDGVFHVVYAAMLVAVAASLAWWGKDNLKDEYGVAPPAVIAFFGAVILLFGAAGMLAQGAGELWNPEYAAVSALRGCR